MHASSATFGCVGAQRWFPNDWGDESFGDGGQGELWRWWAPAAALPGCPQPEISSPKLTPNQTVNSVQDYIIFRKTKKVEKRGKKGEKLP
jgi:hypothetical protein